MNGANSDLDFVYQYVHTTIFSPAAVAAPQLQPQLQGPHGQHPVIVCPKRNDARTCTHYPPQEHEANLLRCDGGAVGDHGSIVWHRGSQGPPYPLVEGPSTWPACYILYQSAQDAGSRVATP